MYRSNVVSPKAVVRVTRRRVATTNAPGPSIPITNPVPPRVPPAPKKRISRRKVLFYTGATVGTFYIGSAFVAFNNDPYYKLFTENVPLGPAIIQFGEINNWDTLTPKKALKNTQAAAIYLKQLATGEAGRQQELSDKAKTAAERARRAAEKVKQDAIHAAETVKRVTAEHTHGVADVIHNTTEQVKKTAGLLTTQIVKSDVVGKVDQAAVSAKHQMNQISEEVGDLVDKAEAALADKAEVVKESFSEEKTPAVEEVVEAAPSNVYTDPLPIGFEPPPGFVRPSAPKPVKASAPAAPATLLPLVAPSISELTASEPVIAQLASTIDDLASYLNSNPAAASKAAGILESAKGDLRALAARIEKVKAEEHEELERKLDEQTKEYVGHLMQLEMDSQDRLDSQEQGFKQLFETEKQKFVQSYREKLHHELRTQTELINERLKEEVIAQGIEMQRRWIREIKVRVEQERGGRLAKLDELAANLKRLERVALDNSSYLDENIRVHALWSALRAISTVVDAPVRQPFREQLRVLRHVAAAREDPVVTTALETLEATDVPDVGIEPFADLASWLSTSVAPQVSSVALVPERNAGVLSHLASHLFSSFRFQRHGLVEGRDVLSVLSRAEHYMNEKDLESATRELNQLKGTAGVLLQDWLAAARRRLEVKQALEVVQSQATLASLLVV